jgi:regulator of sigma E protease
MGILWTIIQFVIVFSILLLIHELGHFIMCRLAGAPVEEFGFGLPPRIYTLFTWKGTAFTLNALPFGAFVRPRGEVDREVVGGLANASPWKKLSVYFGGPLMNILLGLGLLVILFYRLGAPDTGKVMIMEVAPESPAYMAGLKPGDQIITINDDPVDKIETMQQVIRDNLGNAVKITILRGNENINTVATPRLNPPENQGALGVALGNPYNKITIFEAFPRALSMAYGQMRDFVLMPARLIQGSISESESRVVGVKGIFDMYSAAGQMDAETSGGITQQAPVFRLYFIATISIALGLTNLLPIPALDGGRILLVLPELILRRRIPQKVENFLISFSFMALILLMIFITFQDFVNPIKLP